MKNKYEAVVVEKQIIYGMGNIVVVTGWTPKTLVEKKLPADSYAAIGNLYSPNRGIEMLFINLLNNPQVNTVVALKGTRNDSISRSVEKLECIFNKGITTEELRDLSEVLTVEHVDSLRTNIDLVVVETINDLQEAVEINNQPDFIPTREKIKIQPLYTDKENIPGPKAGYIFSGKFYPSWLKLLKTINTYGKLVDSPYGSTKELICVNLILTDSFEDLYKNCEKFNLDREFIDEYLSQYLDENHEPEKSRDTYTYADRLYRRKGNQLEKAIEVLIKPTSGDRRVVLSLWESESDLDSLYPPCLVWIQALVREEKLNFIASFRSSEVFGALPGNVLGIRKLQEEIVSKMNLKGVGVSLGFLSLELNSAHINSTNLPDVVPYLEKSKKRVEQDFIDPTGRFIISLLADESMLEVDWWTNENTSIKTYKIPVEIESVHDLMKNILVDNPSINIEHYSYLYKECISAVLNHQNNQQYLQF